MPGSNRLIFWFFAQTWLLIIARPLFLPFYFLLGFGRSRRISSGEIEAKRKWFGGNCLRESKRDERNSEILLHMTQQWKSTLLYPTRKTKNEWTKFKAIWFEKKWACAPRDRCAMEIQINLTSEGEYMSRRKVPRQKITGSSLAFELSRK